MRAYAPALALLGLILGLSLINEYALEQDSEIWQAQLQHAEQACLQKDMEAVSLHFEAFSRDWSRRQRHLRVVFPHSVLDEVEQVSAQASAFLEMQEEKELLAQLRNLRRELQALRNMEGFSLENIL